jgi:hypothetical protein
MKEQRYFAREFKIQVLRDLYNLNQRFLDRSELIKLQLIAGVFTELIESQTLKIKLGGCWLRISFSFA